MSILPLVPLPIAQVHTLQGAIRYIAHARNRHGFVVQRRYRGVGAPSYRHWHDAYPNRVWRYYRYVESYEEPFLNLSAIQAAGLSAKHIRKWSAAHPGGIFTHPTYAALCLRWGENAYGYYVSELPEQAMEPGAVFFTPHTCWQSGTTYYHWGQATTTDADLRKQIQLTGELRDHVRELGWEGTWQGWYTTDRVAVEKALAPLGRHLVLAQPSIRYATWAVTSGEPQDLLLLTEQLEVARAYYAALPEKSGSYEGFRVAFGHVVQWPGQSAEWGMATDKCVALPADNPSFLQNGAQGAALLPRRLNVNDLADLEECTVTLLPTLAESLTTTGLHQRALAAKLGWPVKEFEERAVHPERLTLAEIEQIARLADRDISPLVAELREEAYARQGGRGWPEMKPYVQPQHDVI